jgi:hypothetical protein
MKKLLLFTLLLFPITAFSQSVKDLFLQIPKEVSDITVENRQKLITETAGDFLKFRLSEAQRGEMKIINRKKDEVLVGMTTNNCDGNDLHIWNVKKGVWKDVTKNVINPIGKEDVVNILRVSPVSISKLDQELGIAMFYAFTTDSTDLRLIARKQDGCDVAGTVYTYIFNGKKFVVKK